MKKFMIALAISGVALMAQTSSAPATSGTKDSTAAPTTKVKKHRHHKKAAATGAPAASSTDAASKPATK